MATNEGWKNYNTWNVFLWLTNDEGLYYGMVEWAKQKAIDPQAKTYKDLIEYLGLDGLRTPDNVAWLGSRLSYRELNDALKPFLDDAKKEMAR